MNESQQTLPQRPYDDEIDLRELFRVLWAGKWLIGAFTFGGALIAVIIALLLPNIYRAEALLSPNQEKAAGGLSAMAAQYSGLANLVGVNLASGSTDKTALGLEILKSRKFISEFIVRHDILVPLMAAKGWDAETGSLTIDQDQYDSTANKWVRKVKPPKTTIPSLQAGYEKFTGLFSVTRDDRTGLVTVAVEHYSPIVAKQWTDWLIEDLNSSIMHQDVSEALEAVAYLEEQIRSTSLSELQNVFFRLIEEQTKTVMLAKVSSEYMFRTIDPAVVPELKSRPKRKFIAFFGLIIGGVLGVLFVFVGRALAPRPPYSSDTARET